MVESRRIRYKANIWHLLLQTLPVFLAIMNLICLPFSSLQVEKSECVLQWRNGARYRGLHRSLRRQAKKQGTPDWRKPCYSSVIWANTALLWCAHPASLWSNVLRRLLYASFPLNKPLSRSALYHPRFTDLLSSRLNSHSDVKVYGWLLSWTWLFLNLI